MNDKEYNFTKNPLQSIIEESKMPQHELKTYLRSIRRSIIEGESYKNCECFDSLPDNIKEILHKNSLDIDNLLKCIDSLTCKKIIDDERSLDDDEKKKESKKDRHYGEDGCKKSEFQIAMEKLGIGEIALKHGNVEKADKIAADLCLFQKGLFLTKSLSKLAGMAFNHKLFPQALSYAEKAFQCTPNDAIATSMYLRALIFNKRYEKAFEIYTYAITQFPLDEEIYFTIFGTHLLNLHESNNIRETIEKFITRHQQVSKGYYVLSKLNEIENNIEEGKKLKKIFEKFNFQDYKGHIGKIATLILLGEYEKCLSFIESIMDSINAFYQIHRYAIICCFHLKDYNKGLAYAKSGHEKCPNKDTLTIMMADCHSRLNQNEEALDILNQIPNLNQNEKALFVYAQVLRHIGKPANAFNTLSAVSRLLGNKSCTGQKREVMYYLVYNELGFLYLREYQKTRKDKYLQLARIQFELASRYIPEKTKTILGLTLVRYEFAINHQRNAKRFIKQLSDLDELLDKLSQTTGISMSALQQSNNILDQIIQYADKHRDFINLDEEAENGEE